MKALSIRQPWAWAIFHAGKNVENRSWSCSHRGELAIHTGQKYDLYGQKWISSHFHVAVPGPNELTRGGIIGIVTMSDCVTDMNSEWFFGEYGFVLTNPQPLTTPFGWPGQLSLFEVPSHFFPK